jgi:hypothetical protein
MAVIAKSLLGILALAPLRIVRVEHLERAAFYAGLFSSLFLSSAG